MLRARAMLNLLEGIPAIYDDYELCNPGQPRESRITPSSTDQRFRLYPNPANSEIIVEYHLSSSTDNRLLIFNLFGQLVKEMILPDIAGNLVAPVNDLLPGIYWYFVSGTGQSTFSGKIIINR